MAMNILTLVPLLLILVSRSHNLEPVKARDPWLWEPKDGKLYHPWWEPGHPGQNRDASPIFGSCMHIHQGEDTEGIFPTIKHNLEDMEIPESFDAREKWPNCSSIKEISNQANCGACWAFGSVEAMSDRICIHSDSKINFHFSADDLVSCCHHCSGCNGSTIDKAYGHWVNHGIVSGGAYGSDEGCRPYEIPPPTEHCKYDCERRHKTPKCVKQCESGYPTPYSQDLHFGKYFYRVRNNVQQIQAEIMTRGPVTATFKVFYDFKECYKGHGIYRYWFGEQLGGHAVKIIGWGVEDGTDYWLVANSWGPHWGDKGFFKFIRGGNDCGIEENVWGGVPAIS